MTVGSSPFSLNFLCAGRKARAIELGRNGRAMYAIIETGGKQYRVQEGDTLKVELLPAAPGEEVRLSDVRLIAGEDGALRVGTPTVEGAEVTAKVLDHVRAPKVIVFKMKCRKNYRRRNGHRQGQTVLKISKISA